MRFDDKPKKYRYYGKPYKNGWVYIVRLSNGNYYTNSATNLSRSIEFHSAGRAKATRDYLPFELVYFEEFDMMRHALDRVDEIRSWTHHQKDELVNGRPDLCSTKAKACFILKSSSLAKKPKVQPKIRPRPIISDVLPF